MKQVVRIGSGWAGCRRYCSASFIRMQVRRTVCAPRSPNMAVFGPQGSTTGELVTKI